MRGPATDEQKLGAVERSIVALKKIWRKTGEQFYRDEFDILGEVAKDYRAKMEKGTDGLRQAHEGANRAEPG